MSALFDFWRTGELENWRTGELENWRTGELENYSCRAMFEESTLVFQRAKPGTSFPVAKRSRFPEGAARS
jgi:hypothetical protein